MSNKELVDKIVMFRTELERQKAGMGIMSLFDTICSYYGEQHRTIKAHLTTIESQNSQIESLKAITELAVKGFKDINAEYMLWITNERDCDQAASNMDDIAENSLSEIERLQNGTT